MIFFFQVEDGIQDRIPSRGLCYVYKSQQSFRVKVIFLLASRLLASTTLIYLCVVVILL